MCLYQTCKKTKIIPKTNEITQDESQITHASNEMEVESSSDDCAPLSNMRKIDVGDLKDDDNLMHADSNDDESYEFNDDESLNTNDNESNERLTNLRKKVYQK